jgi:hypothetical protein
MAHAGGAGLNGAARVREPANDHITGSARGKAKCSEFFQLFRVFRERALFVRGCQRLKDFVNSKARSILRIG